MQAHHLVSEKGVKDSGMGPTLVKLGYNINVRLNLVFLPSTFAGACHLGVQLHRGNHTARTMLDDEKDHLPSYHELVKQLILDNRFDVVEDCPGKHNNHRAKARLKMSKISTDILNMIKNEPKKAPLTSMALCFGKKFIKGCGNIKSLREIPKVGGKTDVINPLTLKEECKWNRNHNGDGRIKYQKRATRYELKKGK
jgi:hypothetical protein